MEFHQIANIFPMLGVEELGELADDIMLNGLHQPIVLYQGQILDGRNRYQACELAGIEPDCTEYEGDDPLGYVLSLNLHRRHLTASQRAALAAEIANLDMGANQHSQGDQNWSPSSNREAAEKLDVSKVYVIDAKKIQRESPEHFDKVKSGELSLQQAKRELQPEPATSTGDADHAETLPAVKAEPKSDIVVEFAGKRINTLDDLMKVKTPDQKLLDQFFELDLAVIKVRKLVTELSAHPSTKIRSILYGRDEITRTLSYQATSLGESAQFYRELSNGEESTGSN